MGEALGLGMLWDWEGEALDLGGELWGWEREALEL